MFENKDYSNSFRVPRYRELVRRYCGVKEEGSLKYCVKG